MATRTSGSSRPSFSASSRGPAGADDPAALDLGRVVFAPDVVVRRPQQAVQRPGQAGGVVEDRVARQARAVFAVRQVVRQRPQAVVDLLAGLVGEAAALGVDEEVAGAEEVDREGGGELRRAEGEPAEEPVHVPERGARFLAPGAGRRRCWRRGRPGRSGRAAGRRRRGRGRPRSRRRRGSRRRRAISVAACGALFSLSESKAPRPARVSRTTRPVTAPSSSRTRRSAAVSYATSMPRSATAAPAAPRAPRRGGPRRRSRRGRRSGRRRGSGARRGSSRGGGRAGDRRSPSRRRSRRASRRGRAGPRRRPRPPAAACGRS